MKSYRLEVVRGHLVATLPEGRAVLDTGSPVSLRLPEMLAGLLGDAVPHLVGTDRLGRAPFMLDVPGGRMVVDPLPQPGATVDLDGIMGVPVVRALVGGDHARMILDTGAWLSYAPHEVVAELEQDGRETDFLPGFGAFETLTYRLTVEMAGVARRIRVGVLPEACAHMMGAFGLPRWILGAEFLLGEPWLFDLAARRLTRVEPRQAA